MVGMYLSWYTPGYTTLGTPLSPTDLSTDLSTVGRKDELPR